MEVVRYDPEAKADVREPMLESPKRGAFLNYFKRDQRFYYTKSAQG